MDWAITIEIDATMYHSAKQAIYAELAKFFNDEVHLKQILDTKTADAVNYSLEDVPGENNGDKWNEQLRKLLYDVNYEKFKQYPELAGKLLGTKNAIIGAYLPGDAVIGTGISIDNLDAKDPSKWGENILGKALMNIRDVLKESAMPEAVPEAMPEIPEAMPEIPEAMPEAVPEAVPKAMPEIPEAMPEAIPEAVPASKKKSRARPAIGALPPSGMAIPSMAIAKEQPVEAPAPPAAQGGATKRTLRMGGQHKST